MKGDSPSYTRWTSAEYLAVAKHALVHLDQGVPPVESFIQAQRAALPKARHRKPHELEKRYASDRARWAHYIAAARGEHSPVDDPPKKRRPRMSSWTLREKAAIARHVDALMRVNPQQTLSTAVLAAQKMLFAEDRQRAASSVYCAVSGGVMDRELEEGRNHLWMLEATEPAAPREVIIPALQVVSPLPVAAPAASRVESAPGGFASAAQAFAADMAASVDRLLKAQSESVLSGLNEKLAAMADRISSGVAAQVERGIRQTVIDTMAQELGGPVAPPAVPVALAVPAMPAAQPPRAADAAKAPPAPDARPQRLKVDVVGLRGPQIEEVRRAFNGSTDIRFIESEHVNAWTPREGAEVVLNSKFVDATAEHRVRKARVHAVRVKGGAPAIVHAIEALHQAHDIPR